MSSEVQREIDDLEAPLCDHAFLELDEGTGKQQDWVMCLFCGEWIAAYHFRGV